MHVHYSTVEEVLISKKKKNASAIAYGEAIKSLGFEFLEKESYSIDDQDPYRVILSRKSDVGIGVTYIESVNGIKFSFNKEDKELGTLAAGLFIAEEDSRGYSIPYPKFQFAAKLADGSNLAVKGILASDGSLIHVQIKQTAKGKKSTDIFIGNEDGAIPIGEFVRPCNLPHLKRCADLVIEPNEHIKK